MVKSRKMKELGEKMTKEALESVEENEVLKKVTKKGYTDKVDFLLRNLGSTDALDLFKDSKVVINFIDGPYSTHSSQKAHTIRPSYLWQSIPTYQSTWMGMKRSIIE